MKKILFIALGALLAASSCTSEVNEEGFIDKANAISFSAYPNKQRAVSGDVTSDNMTNDNFGVVGYSVNNHNIYLYKQDASVYKGVEQKWVSNGDNSGTWEYVNLADLKFWPNNAMDFYAYFPYTDNATFAASNATGEGVTSTTVMTITNVDCSHDVLFAFAGNQNKQQRVPLTFKHAFAKFMKLVIQMPSVGMLNQSGCQIEVKEVEFINTSTSGTINVDNSGVASYASPNVTLKETLVSPVTVNSANTSKALFDNGTNAKGYFFATNSTTAAVNNVKGTGKPMWDGTKDALNSGKLSEKDFVCLKLTCKVWNGTSHYYVGSATVDDYGVIYIPLQGTDANSNSVTTFDAGKRYIYKIVMKDNVGYTDKGDPILTPILFRVYSVVGWKDVEVTITL